MDWRAPVVVIGCAVAFVAGYVIAMLALPTNDQSWHTPYHPVVHLEVSRTVHRTVQPTATLGPIARPTWIPVDVGCRWDRVVLSTWCLDRGQTPAYPYDYGMGAQ